MNLPASGKHGFHYAWVIFAGCCFLCAGSLGSVGGIFGVYLLPVSEGLSIGRGDLAIWTTFLGVADCVSMPMWGYLMQRWNFNLVSTLGAGAIVVTLVAFSFADSAQWFWVWGFVLGLLGYTMIANLVIPTLIGNWFSDGGSRYLGIAYICTGVGTIILAPVFTLIIQAVGWQTTFLINAGLCAVLMLPWTMFLLKLKPADKGLSPYRKEKKTPDVNKFGSLNRGVSTKRALLSFSFWFLFLAILLTSSIRGFNTNMVGIATEMTLGTLDAPAAAMLGATMISAAAAGNIIGKILFGFLCEKAGVIKTALGCVFAIVLGFFLWAFVPGQWSLMLGAFLFGGQTALITVGFPLVARFLYGNKNYPQIWAILVAASPLTGGLSTTLISYAYQWTGTYYAVILVGSAVMSAVAIFIYIASRQLGKLSKDDDRGGQRQSSG